MFNLILGYLLIVMLILGVNITLFLNNYDYSKNKIFFILLITSLIVFVICAFSSTFSTNLLFIYNDFGYIFLITAILLFIIEYYYLKSGINQIFVIGEQLMLFFMTFILSSQLESQSLTDSLLLTLFFFIILIIVSYLSILLHYGKREYEVIVGEFISLEAILFLVLGLTWWSVRTLDYSMFSSILILTPTYQLIYVIIGMVLILLIGLYYNDKQLKKR